MGKWVEKSFWWDDPSETDRHYIDDNGVKWTVRATLRDDGWTAWKARPSTEAAKYGVKVDHWPATGLSATFAYRPGLPGTAARAQHDKAAKQELEAMSSVIDDFAGKKSGFPWWILLLGFVLTRKKRR